MLKTISVYSILFLSLSSPTSITSAWSNAKDVFSIISYLYLSVVFSTKTFFAFTIISSFPFDKFNVTTLFFEYLTSTLNHSAF